MQTHIHLLAAALCLSFSVPLVGCGDDEPVAATRGSRRKGKKKKKKKKGQTVALDMSRVPAKLKNVDWGAESTKERDGESRDPFAVFTEGIVVVPPDETSKGSTPQVLRPIDLYDVDELQLIAIITGTALHKAMVTDPTGLGHIVREGDVVGRGTPMRVQRITRNEVLFKPLKAPSAEDNQPKELRKVLLTQEELEELLP